MYRARFVIALLLVISAALLLAQTSTNCTTTGYCGNNIVGTTNSNSNNDIVYGLPFTIGTAGLTAQDARIQVSTAGGTILVELIRDTNSSGSTIAGGTLVCSATATASVSTMTINLTGCGALLTTGRYWLFFNNNASAVAYKSGSTGQNIWFQASHTCCTAGAITGTVTDATEVTALGMTLASASSDVVSPKRMIVWR